MKRLRVALVFGRFGGAYGRIALNGALAMDPEAYRHTVVAREAGRLATHAHAAGIEVIVGGDLSGYDVVHTHGGTRARVAAARAGVPRIVHTWYQIGQPSLERRAARHTDVFLTAGTATADRALRLGLTTPDRIRMIWPAVDLSVPPGGRTRARHLLDLPIGARVVGAVGRIGRAQRPDVFARAIARLPADVYGVWAGAGAHRPAERVRWLGYREDTAELLPGFDVLAMTGRHDGVPCVVVEATAAGVPLAGYVPELIRAGETGLLTAPGNAVQLAEAIALLLDDPVAARRLVAGARERIGDRCQPRSVAAVLDGIYRDETARIRSF